MPRRRIAGKRRLRALTLQEEFDLLIGPGGDVEWSDEERREAWEEHKDELMALVNPGTHPAAFEDYEDPENET